MGQSWGWFLPRQIHWPFTGRLRPPFFTIFGIGQFTASALASGSPHSVCRWLRLLHASSFTGQAPSFGLWHHRSSLCCSKQAAMANCNSIGHCCLTTHPSRRRSAARLNSGVRPQWGKVRGGSCSGKSTGGFPVSSGQRSSLFSVSVSSRLRPWHHVCRTRFALGFGNSARPALPGKPQSCDCGIIGLRYGGQSRQQWPVG